MVIHKTVSPNTDSRHVRILSKESKIKPPVLIAEKDDLATTPTLNDMVRAIGNDDPGDPAHVVI
jgi:hypothetical protein